MPDSASLPGQSVKSGCPVFLFPPTPLNQRQRDILRLAALGQTDEVIAQTLGISARTVRWHLQRARRVLQATNTTHAVALAVSRGYINVDS